MARVPQYDEKPLFWVSSAKKDFMAFPRAVQKEMGNALGLASLAANIRTRSLGKARGQVF